MGKPYVCPVLKRWNRKGKSNRLRGYLMIRSGVRAREGEGT